MKEFLTNYLLKPRKLYSSVEATNLNAVKQRLVPGDVLLISGNTKKDSTVKILTESLWSRALLYVGHEPDLITEEQKSYWLKQYGKNSVNQLVIESDPIIGTRVIPLDAFVGSMVRHCLPSAIKKDDRARIISFAKRGFESDREYKPELKTVLFFSLPWGFLPYRLREISAEYSLAEGDGICSSLVAKAFHSIGYPIRPLEVIQNRSGKHPFTTQTLRSFKSRGKSAVKLVLSGKLEKAASRVLSRNYARIALSQVRNITPGDYDLSRFFEVKKNPEDLAINY